MLDHLDLNTIDSLTGGRLGRHDAPCPFCGPTKRARVNQRRKVLRIWRLDPGFAGYHCARCGEKGSSRNRNASPPDPVALQRAHAEAAEREREASAERLQKAAWLWSQRQPIVGSDAETYLREARGYGGVLPDTLGFLPGRGEHPPAMIAAFGVPTEPEPGVIHMPAEALRGVHITRLAPGGHGKAGTERDKVMIGRSVGAPIVLAPANDLLATAIAEGIEDALSVHEATRRRGGGGRSPECRRPKIGDRTFRPAASVPESPSQSASSDVLPSIWEDYGKMQAGLRCPKMAACY